MEILRGFRGGGGGVSKANFLRGLGGFKPKQNSLGEVSIFSGTTQKAILLVIGVGFSMITRVSRVWGGLSFGFCR